MIQKITAFAFVILLVFDGFSQRMSPSTREFLRKAKTYSAEDVKRVRKKRKAKKQKDVRIPYNSSVDEARERRKKLKKEMKKKRYTDPSYFGHKRKPKIRPRGKRRLCKECGIVH